MYKGKYTNTIYFDEDIFKILIKIREFIKRVKTQDYYVRGYEDQRVIMLEVLDYIIEVSVVIPKEFDHKED